MEDRDKLIETLKNFEQEHRDLDEILIQLQHFCQIQLLDLSDLKNLVQIDVDVEFDPQSYLI